MYTDRLGRPVSEAEAFDANGVLKDGYGLHINPLIMDGRPRPRTRVFLHDQPPPTLEEEIRTALLKGRDGRSVEEVLVNMKPNEIQKVIAEAAAMYVGRATAAGVAAKLGDGRAILDQGLKIIDGMRYGAARATAAALRDARYGNHVGMPSRPAAKPVQTQDARMQDGRATVNALRAARFGSPASGGGGANSF
ncbi:MAG: hypothetical protein GC201_16355 [Alphaproteobacteria bacterium]|nr:hypothetical protein [Alphaproteobacteria bacterium]